MIDQDQSMEGCDKVKTAATWVRPQLRNNGCFAAEAVSALSFA